MDPNGFDPQEKKATMGQKSKQVDSVFQIRRGSRISQRDAQRMRIVLERLAKSGEVREEDVVRLAAPKNSTIHHMFEWDDAKAAHEHRLQQARTYIGAFEVVFEGSDQPMRAFPSVKIGDRTTYVTAQRALSERDLLEQLVNDAHSQARAWARRWESLREVERLTPIFKAIG